MQRTHVSFIVTQPIVLIYLYPISTVNLRKLSHRITMLRCISHTPEQDEAAGESEQNMNSKDQKTHGRWCRWKSRPTKSQLQRELQALKAINADQAEEIQELHGKLEEVLSLNSEQLDGINNLKDQVGNLKCKVGNLKCKTKYLMSKCYKYALENSKYIQEIRQCKVSIGNASLHLEHLNSEIVAAIEVLKLYDCVLHQKDIDFSTTGANITDKDFMDDKAELTHLLKIAETYVQELKASTVHLIPTSDITEDLTIEGDELDAMILFHATGDVPRRDLIWSICTLQSNVFALKDE